MKYRSPQFRLKYPRPVFTVVVPCHNAAGRLDETLRSVQEQSLKDLEIIVVDEESTDNTAEILDVWVRADIRVRVVRQPSGGSIWARDQAVYRLARGRYIAFLDAGDIWATDKLQQSAVALDGDATLFALYGKTAVFCEAAESARGISRLPDHAVPPNDPPSSNSVCTISNLVVRTDAFRASGAFDPSIAYCENLEWLARFAAVGHRFAGIDETLVYQRSRDARL